MKYLLFKKIVSLFVLFILSMCPSFIFAETIFEDNDGSTGAPNGSEYSKIGSNYTGVSDITKAINDPAGQKSRLSCSKAVPAAQRAITGLQYSKVNPTENDTLLTIFDNIPQLLGGVSGIKNAYKDGSLTPEAKKSWKNFGSNTANTATFGIYNKNQVKKATADGDLSRVKELLEQEKFRIECLDSIKISIATNLLDRGTSEMISFIQTGNFGDPQYVVNGQEWMKRVQDQTIIDIFRPDLNARSSGQNLSNPYALNTIKNIISNSRSTSFQERSQYTLGNTLLNIQNRYGTGNGINNIKEDVDYAEKQQQAIKDFSKDFNKGGWEAWSALTQNAANNPIGYSILAVKEISDKKTQKEKATELENSSQLLSKTECVKELVPAKCIKEFVPAGGTDDNGDEILLEYKTENITISPDDKLCVEKTKEKVITRGITAKPNDSSCVETKVVTPGSLITERMKWFVTSDIRQLELANKFNSSISQILTASVNKIAQIGLDKISVDTIDAWSQNGFSSLRQYSNSRLNFLNGKNRTHINFKNKDYELFLDINSPFWGNDFDLERELNDFQIGCEVKRGLYNTQNEYVKELEYMNNPKTTPLTHIIPAVAVLDMCVPGPTLIWQDLADPYFAEYIDAISAKDPQQLSSPNLSFTKVVDLMNKHAKTAGGLGVAGNLVSSISPVLPPPANGIGMIVGAGLNISSAIIKNKKIDGLVPGDYSNAISTFQQYTPMVLEDEARRNQDNEINDTINAYENYIQYIYDTYSDANNLPVATKAKPIIGNLIEKNENINEIIQAYQSEYQKSVIVRDELKNIKTEVDAIYSTARTRMASKYPDIVDPGDPTGNTMIKWNEIPSICTQSCTNIKQPISPPDFLHIDMLIKGFKLKNGIWGNGKSFRETIAGFNDSSTLLDDNSNINNLDTDSPGINAGGINNSGLFNNTTYTNGNINEVNSNTPTILYFIADKSIIDSGDDLKLEWSLLNTKSVKLTTSTSNVVLNKNNNLSGDTIILNPTKNTTYILTAKNGSEQVTKELKITINKERYE